MSEALDVIREGLRGTPYEGKLYLVGGVLRDRALGLPGSEDVDFVLEGDAVALAEFLFRKGISDHHPVLYPRFGTAKLAVRGHGVELVAARAESYESDSRKPSVVAATLRDDAFRRDFTINTLMENIHTGEVLDLTGRAWEDLRAGVIRTPLDPHVTFFDDPLRMLRAVRFACRYGFTIEDRTWSAIIEMAGRLNLLGPEPPVVSAERIRDEIVKALGASGPALDQVHRSQWTMVKGAAAGLELMRRAGLLKAFLPELLEMVGVTQNAWHLYDVWDHTLIALSHAPPDASLEVRAAILFHDVGKPRTRTEDEKGVHFYEHQFVGAEMAREALNRLRFTNDQIRDVCALVGLHMRLGESRPEWTDAAIRRMIRAIHPYTDALFQITGCDMAAMRRDVPHPDLVSLRARMDRLNAEMNAASAKSPLDGVEIMEILGVAPGPVLRDAKEYLVNQILDGTLVEGDKDAASAILRKWFAERSGESVGMAAGAAG
jgi:poly(A) polymerase